MKFSVIWHTQLTTLGWLENDVGGLIFNEGIVIFCPAASLSTSTECHFTTAVAISDMSSEVFPSCLGESLEPMRREIIVFKFDIETVSINYH